VVCLILQGVTEPVMRVGRGREEGECEAALEDALHVLGGDGGLTVGGDGVKKVTGVGLGRTHKGGGVAAVITVGIEVEAPHVVVGDSMAVVQGATVANEGGVGHAGEGWEAVGGGEVGRVVLVGLIAEGVNVIEPRVKRAA